MVRKIGLLLLFLGIISGAMQLAGYQMVTLSWVNHWGEASGWGIRAALICIGGGLLFLEKLMGDEGLDAEVKH